MTAIRLWEEASKSKEEVAMLDKACGAATWVGTVGTSPVRTLAEIWFGSWGWVGYRQPVGLVMEKWSPKAVIMRRHRDSSDAAGSNFLQK